jgi:hypothetical protein
MTGQLTAGLLAEKFDLRVAALQFGPLRPVAHDDLRAWQLQVQEGLEILLDRHPPHRHEDRPRQIELDRIVRREQIGIDAPCPGTEPPEAAFA